jgi:hypothetical protein
MAVTAAQALNGSINRRGIRAGDPFGGGIPLALVTIAVTLIGFRHDRESPHVWQADLRLSL